MAEAPLFSPWYSHRLFAEQTGLTPSDYIRRYRLARSALKLRDGGRLADAAFETGFGSVDGCRRAFRREFGCNPGEYSANPVPTCLFTPCGVKFRAAERRQEMDGVKNVFIQVIEKPARRGIIKRGVRASDYWTCCGR